ncbi:leucine-rich repeat domain-containing protein [Leucobacter insecticola]|uniref:Leucine-rich repeat domain-containing protein n=1 Tax=Leucobacter insecticola TaxID=2714934 RepID=A0A6G8FH75_9MICO|nr:leucine-rich repeat domain-containing protein [Leucobacter insecticola]QIM15721.1 leucine-rich repeat domain-containing protein [Leucobacter insecticola]
MLAAAGVAAALLAPAALPSPVDAAFAAENNTAQLTSIPVGGAEVGDGSDLFAAAPIPAESAPQGVATFAALPDDNELVDMPDANLRAAVLREVGGSVINRGALRKLQSLTANDRGITDLTGLEYASKLAIVDLSKNPITSIEPLRGLATVRQLNISTTLITDIDAVSTMPILEYLRINWTDVSDLEPVRGLTRMFQLELAGTQVSSIAPVSGFNELLNIYFQETTVSDLSPLAGLPKLTTISAPDTEVSDLSVIAGLPRLRTLNVNGARVSDLTMIATWPNIAVVGFMNQRVTGTPVFASATESTYRTTEATTASFKMPEGIVLQATGSATTTPEGLTVWEDIPADATELTANVSGNFYGTVYSASLSYPLSRADFTNADPVLAVGVTPQFQFTVTDGFLDGPFTIVDGEVPGLTLDETGKFVGAPTTEGTFPLSVRRTDVYGNMIDHVYNVVVGKAPAVVPPVAPEEKPEVKPEVKPVVPATPRPDTAPNTGGLAVTGGNPASTTFLAGIFASLLLGGSLMLVARRARAARSSE